MRFEKFMNIFASLRYRNFRYFWFGQCISLFGTWMQRTAQTWLVYELTDSPLLVGLLTVCQFAPVLLFSLFAGVIADRFPKRKLLLLTQVVFMLQAFVLTFLVWTGYVRYWHVFILAAVYGLTHTLDMPARQSFFIHLVGKEDLMNAISLNSAIVNLARIAGPAAAGMAMAKLGATYCFLINAVTYIAVIIGLYMIDTGNTAVRREGENMLLNIKQGLLYIYRNETLKTTVITIMLVCTFAFNLDVIIPVYVGEVLGKGAEEYSMLLSFLGIGSFLAAIFMAGRSRKGLNRSFMYGSALVMAVLQIIAAFTKTLIPALALAVGMGFALLVFLNMGNSIMQLNTNDEYRGRVMSIYSMVFLGSAPAGNAFTGYVMEKMGASMGFLAGGSITLFIVLLLLLVRRLYTKPSLETNRA